MRDGDIIEIDIPNRSIQVRLTDGELAERRREEETKGKDAFKPVRERKISNALKLYAHFVSSADKGGVRIINS